MKKITIIILILTSTLSFSQVKLDSKDTNNLISIGVFCSDHANADGKEFAEALTKFRSPKLNPLIDVLVETGTKNFVDAKVLSRPSNEVLTLWYVISEINYNHNTENKTIRPDIDIVKEVLEKPIDENLMLCNYYHNLYGGLANLFNEADLKEVNIDLENLSFKNNQEKAICLLNVFDALVGGRFRVLSYMKNPSKLIEFADKLPKVNGKEYYYYTNFDYTDFKLDHDADNDTFNQRYLGGFFAILASHFSSAADVNKIDFAKNLYINSVLHEPKYFQFTPMKADLEEIYKKAK